ncbi:MAG: hypothetical protein ACPIOQ_82120, partial [Promethearchaeia archaeon]
RRIECIQDVLTHTHCICMCVHLPTGTHVCKQVEGEEIDRLTIGEHRAVTRKSDSEDGDRQGLPGALASRSNEEAAGRLRSDTSAGRSTGPSPGDGVRTGGQRGRDGEDLIPDHNRSWHAGRSAVRGALCAGLRRGPGAGTATRHSAQAAKEGADSAAAAVTREGAVVEGATLGGGWVELFRLARSDFETILEKFPVLRTRLQSLSKVRMRRKDSFNVGPRAHR